MRYDIIHNQIIFKTYPGASYIHLEIWNKYLWTKWKKIVFDNPLPLCLATVDKQTTVATIGWIEEKWS